MYIFKSFCIFFAQFCHVKHNHLFECCVSLSGFWCYIWSGTVLTCPWPTVTKWVAVLTFQSSWRWSPTVQIWRLRHSPQWPYNNSLGKIHKICIFYYHDFQLLTHLPLNKMATIFADIFKWIFLNENHRIEIQISLKFIPRSPIDNKPTLVQVMARRRTGDKPLPEPKITQFIDTYMWH